MTPSTVGPVIPRGSGPAPGLTPGPGSHARPGTRPMLVAIPFPAVLRPGDAVYGTGRIDASGRVADRTVSEALGWRGGDRLTITVSEGVIARRDPRGIVTVPARACLAIPSALRRRYQVPRTRAPRPAIAVIICKSCERGGHRVAWRA
jgi:hypothetical protein